VAVRFPGSRNPKHYFPVTKKQSKVVFGWAGKSRWYITGLDQLIVDIEVHERDDLAAEVGLARGESILLDGEKAQRLLRQICDPKCVFAMSAGGSVGNTLNNFTFLSGEPAVLLGAINENIRPGDPAFHYVAQTSKAVDLAYLVERRGSLATAVTFISKNGERSFAVTPGICNDYPAEQLPVRVIQESAAVVTSLYCLRDPAWPIARAAERLMALASEAAIPVALGMGTAGLVRERRQAAQELLARYVTIAAMNVAEAEALTGEKDALLSCQRVLDWVDLVIITEGPRGLTMGGYVDEQFRRETEQEIRSKAIPEYNRWEYSRLMRRGDCQTPQKIYTHIHPYQGGPERLVNTNGAGDAALAAVLHDIVANRYHLATVPQCAKHPADIPFLSYSSLSRCAQYGNRVAYDILIGHSPRLDTAVGPDCALESV